MPVASLLPAERDDISIHRRESTYDKRAEKELGEEELRREVGGKTIIRIRWRSSRRRKENKAVELETKTFWEKQVPYFPLIRHGSHRKRKNRRATQRHRT
jgi:hypothetical protein